MSTLALKAVAFLGIISVSAPAAADWSVTQTVEGSSERELNGNISGSILSNQTLNENLGFTGVPVSPCNATCDLTPGSAFLQSVNQQNIQTTGSYILNFSQVDEYATAGNFEAAGTCMGCIPEYTPEFSGIEQGTSYVTPLNTPAWTVGRVSSGFQSLFQ